MKKLYTILAAVIITAGAFAQPPQKMSYQCVIRNPAGNLIANQSVGMRISILQSSPLGTVVYQETYSPNPVTNSNGLVTVEIGGGIPVTGTFSSINWAAGQYFLKTETDPTGGTTFTITGTSQLLSVPYALYASNAGSANETDPKWSGLPDLTSQIGRTGNVGIGTTNPTAPLHVAGIVRIVDGSQGSNRVLGSDANGNASWIGAPGVDFVENGG